METKARYLWVGLFVLAAIFAGFGFVYWLNNEGGIGKRAYYRIKFQNPVSGLQIGAAVQFNGIRIGEVTKLALNRGDPSEVMATIGIAEGTPLRADTKVDVDFQGLMGTPAISLKGGSPESPFLQGSEKDPPVLVAAEGAGQDLTQTARAALQSVNKILADNADPLKDTLGNVKVFSEALARNSNRIDSILAGLEKFTGGGSAEKPKHIYDLTLSAAAATAKMPPGAQITVGEPTALVTLQTQRFLARLDNGEIAPLGDAQWSDTIPKLFQSKMIEAFENEGVLASVIPPLDQAKPAFQLVIDLRNFAVTGSPEPMANIEFSVKILAEDGHIVGAKLIRASVPAKGIGPDAIVVAFNEAFNQAATELIAWTTMTIAT